MTEQRTCSLCGSPLPANTPGGHCPKCLLGFASGVEPGEVASGELLTPAQIRYFGDYELESEIARGGMGIVYRARQLSLNRPVAIKMILAGQLADPEAIARFKIEAEAAANLDHPHIVPVYEIGEYELQHYFSMKLVEDAQHASRWAVEHRESIGGQRTITSLAEKVAHALSYAHERGVLHRDLKPSNILVDARGEPQLTDFGLAKLADSEHSLVTLSSTALGSPAFMAPEQASGEATVASDVYGMGAVLYQMLTGEPPFQGKTALETLRLAADEAPRPPRVHNALVSEDLETICLKCLEKDPALRYLSARDLADDLARFRRGEPVNARPVGTLGKASRWCRRNPALAAAALVAALATVAGALGVFWQWGEARTERDAARWESYRALTMVASSALEFNQREQMRSALHSAPEEHRNWEWHYFNQSLDRSVKTFVYPQQQHAHRGGMRRLTFGAGGLIGLNRANERSEEQTNVLWDIETGERRDAPVGRIFDSKMERSVEIAADGSCVAKDCLSGEILFEVPLLNGDRLLNLQFIGKDKYVLVDEPDVFTLIEVASGKLVRYPYEPDSPPRWRIVLERANRLLVTWKHLHVYYDLKTGEELSRIAKEDRGGFISFAVSPDESTIAFGDYYPNRDIFLVAADTGETIARLKGHGNSIFCLQFDPTGARLVSAGFDRTPRLWDVAERTEIAALRGHVGRIGNVAFNGEGSRIATASDDGTVRIWDGATGEALRVLRGHENSVRDVAFSPDGNTLASFDTIEIKLWDAASDTVFRGHEKGVYDVAISPDGKEIASASWDYTIRTWDIARREPRRSFEPGHVSVGVAYSPDGRYLAACTHAFLACWRRADGEEMFKIAIGGPYATDSNIPRFSPDSKQLVTWSDGEVRVFDVPSGIERKRLPVDVEAGVAFSPDGNRIAALVGGQARVWDASSYQQLGDFPIGIPGATRHIAYTPDGKLIACSGSGVGLYNADTFEKVGQLTSGFTYAAAFTPDATRCFTACGDGKVRIWDLATFQEVGSLHGHSSFSHGVAMSPDGRTLVSGGGDGRVRIWQLDEDVELELVETDTPPDSDG